MVAELSALQQIVNALTGLDGLPVVIVECVVTTIYTCKRSLMLLVVALIFILLQHLGVFGFPFSRTQYKPQWSSA